MNDKTILQDVFGQLSGGKLLDVATGNGFFIQVLLDHLKDFTEMIGIDTNDKILETARTRFSQPNISFQNMSGEHLKFPDESFDTVCISNSLHHFADIHHILQEMKRVLRNGGYFIIHELFCDGQTEQQLTYVYLHHMRAEMETLLGQTHNNIMAKHEILDLISMLDIGKVTLTEYIDTNFFKQTKLESIVARNRDILEQLRGHAAYETYKQQLEVYTQRLYDTGIELATELLFIGIK